MNSFICVTDKNVSFLFSNRIVNSELFGISFSKIIFFCDNNDLITEKILLMNRLKLYISIRSEI